MKVRMILPFVVVISIFITSLFTGSSLKQVSSAENNAWSNNSSDSYDVTALQEKAGSLHMPFIKNVGQMDETVAYYAPTFGGTVFVTTDGQIVYYLPEKGEEEKGTKGVAIKETAVGGVVDGITGQGSASVQVNYFKGNDRSKWQSNVHTYNMVSMGELYQGISLNLHAYGNNVEKLFVVGPGANLEQIQLKMEGVEGLSIDEEGRLVAVTALGPVTFTKPVAYQEIDGSRKYVDAAYTITKSQKHKSKVENGYGFTVDQYNPDYELLIDPLLASTFLGGSGHDYCVALALDSSNNVYVTGNTNSPDFPTSGNPYGSVYNGGTTDVFVSKLNGSLSTLIASTFLGGSGQDGGLAIAIDSSDNVYVAGATLSSNFPTSGSPYDGSHNGSDDAFIVKLDSSLAALNASTYLGGSDNDYGAAIAIDSSNNVYVAGYTYSNNFPTSGSPYDGSYNGGLYDAFVAKLDSSLSTLSASTFLGGSDHDRGHAIALDNSNNVYVTGWTGSTDFPTSGSPYDSALGGNRDAFVSKLNSGLSSLSASTFLGGSGLDQIYAITIDSSNNVYVAGYTGSADFPTAGSPYDNTYNGSDDAFVAKLNSSLGTLDASTFLGGSNGEYCNTIALDSSNNAYVVGHTSSADFPTAGSPYDSTHNGGDDVFVTRLNSGLSSLNASTFLGGSGNDPGYAIALDSSNNVYVAGYTSSTGFPTSGSPYDGIHNGGIDVFVAKFDSNLSAAGPCTLDLDTTFTGGTLNMGFTVGSTSPVTWNVFLSVADIAVPLFSIPLPAIDPPISVPLSFPGFPDLGGIGVLTTLTTADGIICSDWETVDTSPPVAPTLFKLPDTGQTQDFTPTFGEDSDYTINPPSYTDNGDGTVTDNNTGLMWQQEDDNVYRNWNDAISYCGSLSLAGHSDWRLPDVKELEDIVNMGNYHPAIDETYFPSTNPGYFHSSSTHATFPSDAFRVSFSDGYVDHGGKSGISIVRCVRGEQTPPNLTDNGDGTVTDNITGLMWQQEDDGVQRTWDDAISYCEGFSFASYSDWRLPDLKELQSIVDNSEYDPAIDETNFPNTDSWHYWSSTATQGDPILALMVDFTSGWSTNRYMLSEGYVRCVQGGQ